MARVAAVYQQVLAEHRSRLARLTERRGAERLRKLYDDAQDDVLRKISRRAGSGRNDFTSVHLRAILAQIRQGQALIAARLAGELGDLSLEAQTESLRGLTSDMRRLETAFTGTTPVLPIEESARFAGIVDKRRSSLMRLHETSMARYGTAIVKKMEGQLALSLATGETTDGAIDRLHAVVGGEKWRCEMIARTETSFAYSQATVDGIKALATTVPDVYVLWSEHVDQAGHPLDDRVGVDSLAMANQVAKPGDPFTMPPSAPNGELVDKSLVGQTWTETPCRPNGRESLVPWRPGWGVPAWRWAGRRVPMR